MRGLNEYYPLGTPVSFICLSGENRRAATASKFGNGSRVTVASLSPPFRSSQITYRYTGGFISAGATYPCRATRLLVITDGTSGLYLMINVIP